MKKSTSNRLILFFTCLFSMFAVAVAGISTFARFQQAFSNPSSINQGAIQSGSNDLTIDGVTGYKYVYDDTGNGLDYNSGHIASYGAYGTDVIENISQDHASSGEDVPLEGVGYYCKGDEKWAVTKGNGKMPWTYASAVRLEDKYGTNHALLRNTHFSIDEVISLHHYYFTEENNEVVSTETAITTLGSGGGVCSISDGKITFTAGGDYNIWINSSDVIYVEVVTSDPVANSLSRASIKKTQSTVDNQDYTKLIIDETSCDWDYNTLWLDNLGFTGDYAVDDFEYFASQYYGTQDNNMGASSTTRSWKRYSNGFNLCAGGSGTVHEYILPPRLSYCSISIQTSRSGSYNINVNYLNNLAEQAGHNQYNEYMYGKDSGHVGTGKTVTFEGHFYNNLSKDYRPNGYNGWNSIVFLTSIDDNEDDYSWTTNTVSVSYVDSTGSTISDLSGSSSEEINCNLYSVDTYTNTGTYTFSGVYYSRTNSFASKTSTSSGSKLRVENGFTIYVVYVIPTYYTMHILKWNYPVASQPALNSWSTYSASAWSNFTGEVTYNVTLNTNQTFNTNTAANTSKYSTEDYTWCGVWYTYDGSSYTALNSNTGVVGSTSSGSPAHLYTYVVEKTTTITFHKAVKTGDTSGITEAYNAYAATDLNLKLANFTNTNVLNWGYTGTFKATDYVNIPSFDSDNYVGLGWNNQITDDNVNTAYTNGTSIKAATDIYYKIKESPYSISFTYSFFVDGAAYTGPSTTTGISATAFNSGGTYLPKITVGTIGYSDNSQDYANAFYVFDWDGYAYTSATCKENEKYTGPATSTQSLYLKMVARNMITLYFVKPTEDGNVKDWYHIKANCYYKDGNSKSAPNSEDCGGDIALQYISKIGYYCVQVPQDCYFVLKGYNQSGSADVFTIKYTAEINLGYNDARGNARNGKNVIQLWSTGGREWKAEAEDAFYIVGTNLTNGGATGEDWSDENGIPMEKSTPGSYIPDQIAFAKHIYLSNDVVFKLHNSLGAQWYGAERLKTGENEETQEYVEGVDDGKGGWNIKMKSGKSGYFDVYIDKSYYIHIEDAEKAAYIFFTDVAGDAGTTSYKMGSGDDTYNLAMYEQGLTIKAGDTFAIRNRRRGTYDWYAYDDLDDDYSFIETTSVPTSTANQLGDGDLGVPSHLEANTKLIKFKEGSDGVYQFYLKKTNSGAKIVIKEITPDVSYGYYIKTNEAGAAPSSLTTTGAIQLRTVTSGGLNVAVYSGFHVTTSTRYSVFSIREEGESVVTTGYTNYYDGCEELYGESEQAFTETKTNHAYNGNYVTLNPGYYNIYIRESGGTYYVSFNKFNYGGFFAMNSIQYGVTTANGVYNSNTSLILRVAFTVKNTSTVDFSVLNQQIGSNENGLHSFLNFSFILDPVGIDGETNPNPYNSIRETYFDNLHSYSATPSLELQNTGDDTFAASATNGNKHYLYILIDYDYARLRDVNEALTTDSQKERDFYFVLKTTQN